MFLALAPFKLCKHIIIQPCPKRCDAHSPDEITGKRVAQKTLGLGSIQAAGPEIKKRIFVELSNCRAVAAFHIIGVDFQLGLGVYYRMFRE
jgi:hypothetical protein